jgi:hypothetical protein
LITIDKNKIFLTQISSDFTNTQSIYTIVQRNAVGIYSIKVDLISFDTLIFREKSGEGSMVTHHLLGATVWVLGCDKE